MDLLTLCLTDRFLRVRSVREVARQTGRAPSTVSGALARTEAAIARPLVRRDGAALVLTLEGEMQASRIAAAADAAHALLAAAGRPPAPVPAIRIATLARFLAVAQGGSIRAAARRLGIGQPQLTRQMAELDRQLGSPLLERGRGGSTLTRTGQAMLDPSEALVAAWDSIAQGAPDRFRQEIATWRIGSVLPMGHESTIARMLARLIAHWSAGGGRQQLMLSNQTADELMLGLKTRRFDLVLLDHAKVPRDLLFETLVVTPLALFGTADRLPMDNVAGALRRSPLAVPSGRSGLRQEIMAYLEAAVGRADLHGLKLVEVDSIPVIINLVAHHGHLSVLPLDAVRHLPFNLAHISLAPDHMQRLVMVWRHSGLPEPLLDAVRKVSAVVSYPT